MVIPIFIATISLIAHLLLIFVVMLDKTLIGYPSTSPHCPLCSLCLCHVWVTVAMLIAVKSHLSGLSCLSAVTWSLCPGCLLSTLSQASLLSRWQRTAITEFSRMSVFLSLAIPYHLHDGSIFLSFPGKIFSWLLL